MSNPETPAQRRRQNADKTEDELIREEDRAFYTSLGQLKAIEAWGKPLERENNLLRDRLSPNQLVSHPKGRPSGSSVVDLAVLEQATEDMRRDRTTFTIDNLVERVPYSRSTVLRWFAKHPGTQQALRLRSQGLK